MLAVSAPAKITNITMAKETRPPKYPTPQPIPEINPMFFFEDMSDKNEAQILSPIIQAALLITIIPMASHISPGPTKNRKLVKSEQISVDMIKYVFLWPLKSQRTPIKGDKTNAIKLDRLIASAHKVFALWPSGTIVETKKTEKTTVIMTVV